MAEVKHKKVKRKEAGLRTEATIAADHLHSAAIHLLRRLRRQDAGSGIGPAQLSALSVLVFAGPRTLGELAAAEQVKPPTMSRIVAGLKRGRLVKLTRDIKDGRRLLVQASPQGARLLGKARRRRIEDLALQLEALTRSEIAQLDAAAGLLEKLLRDWR